MVTMRVSDKHLKKILDAQRIQNDALAEGRRALEADKNLRDDMKRNHYAEMLFRALGGDRHDDKK